jgi:hypothetical protein
VFSGKEKGHGVYVCLPLSTAQNVRWARKAHTGQSLTREADVLHINPIELTEKALKFREGDIAVKQAQAAAIRFPASTSKVWTPETLTSDNVLIISDVEVPDHDPWMLYAALAVAMQYDLKTMANLTVSDRAQVARMLGNDLTCYEDIAEVSAPLRLKMVSLSRTDTLNTRP